MQMENGSSVTPLPYDLNDVDIGFQKWRELSRGDTLLGDWMSLVEAPSHPLNPLLAAVFGDSPYLTRLLLHYPDVLFEMSMTSADEAWNMLIASLYEPVIDQAGLMKQLRVAKNKAALLIGLADLGGLWGLLQVTEALSAIAEQSLRLAVDFCLGLAHKRGEVVLADTVMPSEGSGIIVLGMGKLGGRELNYSSDIDLIIFFEPGRREYTGRLSEQKFMTRLSHDIVTIMQERNANGYVFRTDLRLRPDPASTPPAVSTEAAYYYYESVGQNWERAAMIKARPVAGDIIAGERFLKRIAPFMWRRNLDFAAINDIHSIKRQMDSKHSKTIEVKGHNIKLGHGGIREIEFYVQIHQLIWGGRETVLRTKATCETLRRLSEYGLIDAAREKWLVEDYAYFRTLEHRLQMVNDEQTHTMPATDEGVLRIAKFMGYDTTAAFEAELLPRLTRVHELYASSFKGSGGGDVLGDEGNLVFTGVSHDPETLETLHKMGYANPETVSEIVMGWHHGSRKATRTKRARELLTEMMPLLLKRLSETANADMAFLKFN